MILVNANPCHQVLVQWIGLLGDEASWEDLDAFKHNFPTFSLVDKVISEKVESETAQIDNKFVKTCILWCTSKP